MAQTDIETLDSLPIKNVNTADQKKLTDVVDKILSITKSKDYLKNSNMQSMVKENENKIDQIVYEFYELTSEEIDVIKNSSK